MDAATTLDEWRRQVPHGKFFQPIRLTVKRPAPPPPRSIAADSSTAPDGKGGVPNEQPQPTQSALNGKQHTVDGQEDRVVVIPAFGSVTIPGRQQQQQQQQQQQECVALNVGGPVWAMDWLPSQAAPQPENVKPADDEAKTQRSKKRGRPSTSAKGKRKQSDQVEKENAAVNEIAPQLEPVKHGDDSLVWRFLALSTHPPCEVRDEQVVRPTPPDHHYDAQEGTRSLIQIWAVPVLGSSGNKCTLPRPRLVYGIEHSSGVAWEMQWSPLVEQMPGEIRARDLLGVLAVVFGDGSLQVFAVPAIPRERLQGVEIDGDNAAPSPRIEELPPLVTATLPRIVPLCVQWSPRRWNWLLTGASDGSAALWNIKPSIASANTIDPEPLEPQRRFQDADTIGKQDAFEWGNGWAAIRAVSWSPFDDFIFVTTGNDSLFKIWDIREPRICLRSHRIRSTWGNAIQWVNDTSVEISGDQGSIYHYDTVSGSYQKLHFHPQVDSPIWDIQLARREPSPILMSACASGSIRAAPARKVHRTPQNCVEFCRVSGRKSASIHDEYKELTVDFELTTILGSSEGMGPGIREFCERDAALHRLRLTTVRPNEFPCLLASAGHAGLVLILEMQCMLDNLVANHFQPIRKKTGRPKKLRFPYVGATHPVAPTRTALVDKPPSRRRHVTLGAFAEVKPRRMLAKKKGKMRQTASRVSVKYNLKNGVDPGADGVEEEEEEEEEELEDDESESDISPDLDDDENSDDDRVTLSDNYTDDDTEAFPQQLNPNEVRLMSEYQLDLSEEDAILLAIQMSEADHGQNVAPAAANTASADSQAQVSTSQNGEQAAATAAPVPAKGNKKKEKTVVKRKASAKKAKPVPLLSKQEHVARASSSHSKGVAADGVNAAVKIESLVEETKRSPAAKKAGKKHMKKQTSSPSGKGVASEDELVVDQATAFQMIAYQRGLTEEAALAEAIRLSEMNTKRRSMRSKRPIARAGSKQFGSPVSTVQQSTSRRQRMEPPRKASTLSVRPAAAGVSGEPTTPANATKQDTPTAEAATVNLDTDASEAATVATPTTVAPPPPTKSTEAQVSPDKPVRRQRKAASHTQASRKMKTEAAAAADSAKRKRTDKIPAPKRRARSDSLLQGVGGELLSEQEALLMALKTSEIEY